MANSVYQESYCQHITIISYIWKRARRHDRNLPTLRTNIRKIVRLLGYVPNYASVAYCVPRYELRATRCILQPCLTCWLLQNLTGCTLHTHILGVIAVKMQYRWYVWNYFALISSTDVKCTGSYKAWYLLSYHLYKCTTELTQALEIDFG